MNVVGGTNLRNSCMDELRQEGSNMSSVETNGCLTALTFIILDPNKSLVHRWSVLQI